MQYIGGKNGCGDIVRIINELLPTNGSYWEPFVGAGRIIQNVKCKKRYGSDLHEPIIKLLRSVQEGWLPPSKVSEEEYKKWMKKKDESHPMVGFCGHGLSFGGRFFQGYARNAEEWCYASSARCSLLAQKPFLAGVDLRVRDYLSGFWKDFQPSLIYCDPPYIGTKPVGGETSFCHESFWNWCVEQHRKGSLVLVSEYTKPNVPVSVVWQKTMQRKLRSKDSSVKTEYLFSLDVGTKRKVGFGL